MKPISVRFACFGPYVQEQSVDFGALEKNGIFLICGETGAGKTTILDAICYALYGRSSGGLRGDISVMRCKLATKDQETFTEFIFESGGKQYRFVRSLKYGRKNLNDSHNCMELQDGVWVPIFENPKASNVNKEAERIVGLTYEQFRQVIILPQGQFERLLVSDSAEKEKILVSLFHADRWQRITDELVRRIAERDNSLKKDKLKITTKLEEHGCVSLDELAEKIDRRSADMEALAAELKQAETAASEARKANEQAVLENRDFAELAIRTRRLTALRSRESEMAGEEALLLLADAAERIRPQYRQYHESETAAQKIREQLQKTERQLEQSDKSLAALENLRTQQENSRDRYRRMKEEIVRLEDAREVYACLPEKTAAANAAQDRLQKAGIRRETAQRQFDSADTAWIAAQRKQQEAISTYQAAQAHYLQNIGSILARELVDGMPCPVCGSREHPSPAAFAGEAVTAQQVEDCNQRMNRANAAVSQAMRQRTAAEQALQEAAESFAACQQAYAVAVQERQAAYDRRFPKIDTPEQLESRIARHKENVAGFEKTEARLTEDIRNAHAQVLAAQQQLAERTSALKEAEAARETARQVWQKAMEDAGFQTEARFHEADLKPEEQQRRRTALSQYRAELAAAANAAEEQEALLSGRTAPDLAAVRKAMLAGEERLRILSGQLLLGTQKLEIMRADAVRLNKQLVQYNHARLETDADLEFANRLRGRSGVSLQRYVLGVMLSAITAEANRLLADVYGGRYRLYRTDSISGSGHKGGLELEVSDSQNNQLRSVTTLSGGEKFLVALSLAIGLSAVVQAQGQGIRLEAMFVDEGFGSLDREAVLDALTVLRDIRQSNVTVGIISHVDTLREFIPTRLEVTKGPRGSQMTVKG